MSINLPNRITLLRILSIPIFMVFLLLPIKGGPLIAIVIFALAALSDAIDGWLARSFKQTTAFGQFADPIADKLLIMAALLAFIQRDEISAVPVMIILSREFLVTGLRIWAAAQAQIIKASTLGKLKTLSHIGLVFIILGDSYWGWGLSGEIVKNIFIYVAVILAVASAVEYFYNSRRLFSRL